MKRVVLAAAALVAAVAVWIAVSLPPAHIALPPPADDPAIVPGVFHVHTNRSDGRSSPEEIAAAAARAGLEALGFELFADPRHASRTVTAAHVPDGLDWKAFNGELQARGLVLAGGQGKLKGRIFRLGHLGSVTVEEILGAIATLEAVSVEYGRAVEPGAAVAAAQRAAMATTGVFSMSVAGTTA